MEVAGSGSALLVQRLAEIGRWPWIPNPELGAPGGGGVGSGLEQWTENAAGSWRNCPQSQVKKGQDEEQEQGRGGNRSCPLEIGTPLSPPGPV